jgi:hypothetical protein
MSSKWTLPILIFFLCSSGAVQANPLDSPDIVYIDGLPCNRACQSYMAWSTQALSARHRGEREAGMVVAPAEKGMAVRQPARPRVASHPVPMPRPATRAGMAALNAKASSTGKAAASSSAHQPVRKVPAATVAATGEKAVAGSQQPERKLQSADRSEPEQPATIAAAQPAEASRSEIKSEVKPEAKAEATSQVTLPPPATLDVAAPPATSEMAALSATAAIAPGLMPRTAQQQVIEAMAMADRLTAITLVREPTGTSANPATETDEAASGSPDNPDNLVALVAARPEIHSLSDLNNKPLAIEQKQLAAGGGFAAALIAAGAAEVQFSEGTAPPVDRLISGEVPAAVLTLATREAAEWFPDIEGFRIFRVPLSR